MARDEADLGISGASKPDPRLNHYVCSSCKYELTPDKFSKTQLRRINTTGGMRCKRCVADKTNAANGSTDAVEDTTATSKLQNSSASTSLVCRSCKKSLAPENFSKTQHKKKSTGEGMRCRTCVGIAGRSATQSSSCTEPLHVDAPLLRVCCACSNLGGREIFNAQQWIKGGGEARCNSCVAADNWGEDSREDNPSMASILEAIINQTNTGEGRAGSIKPEQPSVACQACSDEALSGAFSARQWLNFQTMGLARCKACVRRDFWGEGVSPEVGRDLMDLDQPVVPCQACNVDLMPDDFSAHQWRNYQKQALARCLMCEDNNRWGRFNNRDDDSDAEGEDAEYADGNFGTSYVRECSGCHERRLDSEYSKDEWKLPRGKARCKACVRDGVPISRLGKDSVADEEEIERTIRCEGCSRELVRIKLTDEEFALGIRATCNACRSGKHVRRVEPDAPPSGTHKGHGKAKSSTETPGTENMVCIWCKKSKDADKFSHYEWMRGKGMAWCFNCKKDNPANYSDPKACKSVPSKAKTPNECSSTRDAFITGSHALRKSSDAKPMSDVSSSVVNRTKKSHSDTKKAIQPQEFAADGDSDWEDCSDSDHHESNTTKANGDQSKTAKDTLGKSPANTSTKSTAKTTESNPQDSDGSDDWEDCSEAESRSTTSTQRPDFMWNMATTSQLEARIEELQRQLCGPEKSGSGSSGARTATQGEFGRGSSATTRGGSHADVNTHDRTKEAKHSDGSDGWDDHSDNYSNPTAGRRRPFLWNMASASQLQARAEELRRQLCGPEESASGTSSAPTDAPGIVGRDSGATTRGVLHADANTEFRTHESDQSDQHDSDGSDDGDDYSDGYSTAGRRRPFLWNMASASQIQARTEELRRQLYGPEESGSGSSNARTGAQGGVGFGTRATNTGSTNKVDGSAAGSRTVGDDGSGDSECDDDAEEDEEDYTDEEEESDYENTPIRLASRRILGHRDMNDRYSDDEDLREGLLDLLDRQGEGFDVRGRPSELMPAIRTLRRGILSSSTAEARANYFQTDPTVDLEAEISDEEGLRIALGLDDGEDWSDEDEDEDEDEDDFEGEYIRSFHIPAIRRAMLAQELFDGDSPEDYWGARDEFIRRLDNMVREGYGMGDESAFSSDEYSDHDDWFTGFQARGPLATPENTPIRVAVRRILGSHRMCDMYSDDEELQTQMLDLLEMTGEGYDIRGNPEQLMPAIAVLRSTMLPDDQFIRRDFSDVEGLQNALGLHTENENADASRSAAGAHIPRAPGRTGRTGRATGLPGTRNQCAVDRDCAVCLEVIRADLDHASEGNSRRLDCGHFFHEVCVRNLIIYSRNRSCPVCRSQFR